MIKAALIALLLSGSLFCASAQSSPPRRVAVGDMAPDFTLEDQDGRALTLSAERGRRPVVLVFYRGYW